jgi:hypothetical protein
LLLPDQLLQPWRREVRLDDRKRLRHGRELRGRGRRRGMGRVGLRDPAGGSSRPYCVLPTPTPGKPCLEDAECGGYPGSCFRDPSLFCFAAGTNFRVADECLDPPYTGCTPVCTERSNPANVGAECAGDEDCREGTTCKTTCDLSALWLSTSCVSQPTCQW